MKYLLIILLAFPACKENGSAGVTLPDAAPIDSPPGHEDRVPGSDDDPDVGEYVFCDSDPTYYCEVPTITCEDGDHSCRDPQFMTIATEDECQMAADWSPGVNIYLNLQINENSMLGYWRIDNAGVVQGWTQPHAEDNLSITLIDTSIDGGWISSGDCDMHVVSSLAGFDEVRWQGITL